MMMNVFAVVSRRWFLTRDSSEHSCLSTDLECAEILNSEMKEENAYTTIN